MEEHPDSSTNCIFYAFPKHSNLLLLFLKFKIRVVNIVLSFHFDQTSWNGEII